MSTIKLIDIYKDFNDGDEVIHALKPTSFTVEDNQFVAIIGPSGSGKSTLLTILGALQRPSGGEIYIDDMEIGSLGDKEKTAIRFDKIGFILQASNLLSYLRVEEQLKLKADYAKKKYDRARSMGLLKQLGIEKIADKYPDQISGGERQRAAIASALYSDPSLILADEPTASLDSIKAMEVVNILKDITRSKDKTVIMVTHDTRLLVMCDRVLKIVDGELKELNKKNIKS